MLVCKAPKWRLHQTCSSFPSLKRETIRPRRLRPVRPVLWMLRTALLFVSKQITRSTSPISRPSSPTQVDTKTLYPPPRKFSRICASKEFNDNKENKLVQCLGRHKTSCPNVNALKSKTSHANSASHVLASKILSMLSSSEKDQIPKDDRKDTIHEGRHPSSKQQMS